MTCCTTTNARHRRIYRIDTSDYSSATNYLDIGVHLNEGSLDVAGMGRMGDVIVASAVSSQWWNTEGSGGIVRWNATSNSWLPDILPDTSIEVMEVLQTANGDTWIQYGDDGVEVLDANGTQVLGWSASETPDLPNGQAATPWVAACRMGERLFASEMASVRTIQPRAHGPRIGRQRARLKSTNFGPTETSSSSAPPAAKAGTPTAW